MFPPCRIRVSGGFVLLAGWFVLANGWEPLVTVLGAAAVHEWGHWVLLRMLGAEVTGFRLSVLGAVLETDSGRLSYGGELAAVLAGPAANLLSALALTAVAKGRWPAAVGANLILCAFNLLPIRPLDGGRALYLLTAWLAGPAAGETAARWAGTVTAAALAALIGGVIWTTGGSLWLLPALAAGLYWSAGPWFSGTHA
jgi:stage IV sporulation protein FB